MRRAIATAFLLLAPAAGAWGDADQPGSVAGPAASDDRARAAELLEELDLVLARTEVAHERVERVWTILQKLEELSAGEVDGADPVAVVEATRELTSMLKEQMDALYRDAVTVHDGIERDVIPMQEANAARVEARLSTMPPDHPDREEIRSIYEDAVVQRTQIEDQLARLGANIEALRAVRARLADRMSVVELWKAVNLKGAQLVERLRAFNRKVEEIARVLAPVAG